MQCKTLFVLIRFMFYSRYSGVHVGKPQIASNSNPETHWNNKVFLRKLRTLIDDKMIRFTTPHAGCMIYLMLSIVINLFILILRISAHEAQNNGTVIPTPHDFDATAAASVKTMTEEITTETGKWVTVCPWHGTVQCPIMCGQNVVIIWIILSNILFIASFMYIAARSCRQI